MVSTQTGALTEWHAQKLVALTDGLYSLRKHSPWSCIFTQVPCHGRSAGIYVLNQFCTCHQHGGLAFSLRFHTIPWQLHSQFEIFEMQHMCLYPVIWGHMRQSFSSQFVQRTDSFLLLTEESPDSLAYACALNESCQGFVLIFFFVQNLTWYY